MRLLFLVLLLTFIPLGFGYWVNCSASHPPTRAYVPTRCTRYCTTHGCRHATRANSPLYFRLRPLYAATVRGLQVGGARQYALVNVLFYLLLLPGLLFWLSYGALRNAGTIRQLKHPFRS